MRFTEEEVRDLASLIRFMDNLDEENVALAHKTAILRSFESGRRDVKELRESFIKRYHGELKLRSKDLMALNFYKELVGVT